MTAKIIKHCLFAGLVVLPYIAQAAVPVIQVKYMPVAPVIDGNISEDTAWTNLTWHGDFKTYRRAAPVVRKTRFKLGYGDDSFYLAIECEDPGIGKRNIPALDLNPVIWRDDTVEIFFSTRDDFSMEQLIINAAGARSNKQIVKRIFTKTDYLWNWDAKVQREADAWRIEVKIPYSLIDFSRGVLKNVRFNIGRTSTAINEISSWAPQPRLFLETANFGRLEFEDTPALTRIRNNYPAIMLSAAVKQLTRRWKKQKSEWFDSEDKFCLELYLKYKPEICGIDMTMQKADLLSAADYNMLTWRINQLFKQMTRLDKDIYRHRRSAVAYGIWPYRRAASK